MKLKTLTISILSIFLLASCATGDFCIVYQPVGEIDEEIATRLVLENRPQAVAIAANETYYDGCPL